MNLTPYTYVILRTDIPQVQQIVQASHAALEAGFRFKQPDSVSHLILLSVKSEDKLKETAHNLCELDIDFHMFYEPDVSQFTAICTRPLFGSECDIFKRYKLFK